MALSTKITTPSDLDEDRLVCPLGHHNWERTNGAYTCNQCANWGGADPEFAELRDKRTGELVPRDAVTFADETR